MATNVVPIVVAVAARPVRRFDVTNHHTHYEAVVTVNPGEDSEWQYREHFPYMQALQRELTRFSIWGTNIELWMDGVQRRY